MPSIVIRSVTTQDARFQLRPGEGADAIHTDPVYAYAVTLLNTDSPHTGVGLAFTIGDGNNLVCEAIQVLAELLVGQEIEVLMADFGRTFRAIADHTRMRWLGPHKGVVHLALASIVNACFDLWAKARRVPLWKLLLDLTPEQIVALCDLSYLEEVLTADDALALLRQAQPDRDRRETVLQTGYPGYDTSVGWFHYDDDRIRDNARRAVAAGFSAIKLKVGSADSQRDIRRVNLVREAAGDHVKLMVDCNQQWTLPKALEVCQALKSASLYWIEEPTHPDDVIAHQTLARAIAPVAIAAGEHIPNRVLFKNFMQAGAAHFIQVDCVRVGGVSEFITITLLAKKFGLPVVPHVGDMGQIHQHLVLFNHVALNHEVIFLEYIPHLSEYFRQPARVENGLYRTPQEPGSSSDLR
jgi:L-fuconate dehydratase